MARMNCACLLPGMRPASYSDSGLTSIIGSPFCLANCSSCGEINWACSGSKPAGRWTLSISLNRQSLAKCKLMRRAADRLELPQAMHLLCRQELVVLVSQQSSCA